MIRASNPSGITLYFDETAHRYVTESGVELTSVTRWVGSFFPKFNSQQIAERYARKHGLSVESVLAEWAMAKDRGSELGHIVHKYAESTLCNLLFDRTQYEAYEEYFQAIDRIIPKLLKRFRLIGAEIIVFSEKLGLAGTIDLLMRDPKNKDILIFDWKTNKEIRTKNNYNQFALEPISHLDDCHLAKYSLQLNSYKRIMKEENYYPGAEYRMALIHLMNQRGDITDKWYKIPYMDNEINLMLEWI